VRIRVALAQIFVQSVLEDASACPKGQTHSISRAD
jgi:hypothetical protein